MSSMAYPGHSASPRGGVREYVDNGCNTPPLALRIVYCMHDVLVLCLLGSQARLMGLSPTVWVDGGLGMD